MSIWSTQLRIRGALLTFFHLCMCQGSVSTLVCCFWSLVLLNPEVTSLIFASYTELNQLTGIAAILRFPLPDLEDIEM